MFSQQDLLNSLKNVLIQQKSLTTNVNNTQKTLSTSSQIILDQLINQLIRVNFNTIQLLNTLANNSNEQTQPQLVTIKKRSKFQKPQKQQSSSRSKFNNNQNISTVKQYLVQLKSTCQKLFKSFFSQSTTLNNNNYKLTKENTNKDEILLKQQHFMILAKSYCLIIVLKLQFEINSSFYQQKNDQMGLPSVQQEIYRLQSLLGFAKKYQQHSQKTLSISLAAKLTKLCINQLLNLQSINEYEYYNINSNEQFKYDQKTQQKFLYLLSVIKLSSHLKLFAYQKKSIQEIKVIQKIYQQGKDALVRLEGLRESILKNDYDGLKNSTDSKKGSKEIKTQQIRSYLTWVEPNWVEFLRQKMNKKSTTKQFEQLPIQYMPIYELFFIIHKLSQFQQQYIQKIDVKKFDFQYKSQVLKSAQQKRILIKKYLQGVKSKENPLQSKKQTNFSQQEKINVVLQWALKQIEAFMKKCEQNCNKISLQKLNNLLNHNALCQVIKQIQTRKKTQSHIKQSISQERSFKFTQSTFVNEIVMEKIADISQMKMKQTKPSSGKQLRNKKESNISEKQSSKKQVNIFKQFQNQSNKQPLTPTKKSSKNILLSNGLITEKNALSFCTKGQYLKKFNYNNNSYAKKFVKLSTKSNAILWADKKDQINDDPSQQSFNKVFGLVYGDVTQKMRYHCQLSNYSAHLVQPWKCFSIICKNRTLDFLCEQNEVQVFFWLNGLATYMRQEKKIKCNFSHGKMLWKKMLLKLKFKFLNSKQFQNKKDKKRFYLGKYNARAIINYGKHIKSLQNIQQNSKNSNQ